MVRFVVRRVLSGVVTLLILSVIVFVGASLLPGNPGRAALGQFATEESVRAVNESLGYYDPLPVRYLTWLGGLVRGDLGDSTAFHAPVSSLLFAAVGNSMQLAAVALVVVIPLSVVLGVAAAYRKGRFLDRAVVVAGVSVAAVPEFVVGILLLLLLAIWWPVLPVSALPPPGSGFLTNIGHLILPAMALMPVFFGYIARVARAGTLEELATPYARTAVLKGASPAALLFRHVLRNALLPTAAVIATQIGYLVGGLVVVERLFNYPGLGLTMLHASEQKDFPMLAGSVMIIGAGYVVLTLLSDLLQMALNPRLRGGPR